MAQVCWWWSKGGKWRKSMEQGDQHGKHVASSHQLAGHVGLCCVLPLHVLCMFQAPITRLWSIFHSCLGIKFHSLFCLFKVSQELTITSLKKKKNKIKELRTFNRTPCCQAWEKHDTAAPFEAVHTYNSNINNCVLLVIYFIFLFGDKVFILCFVCLKYHKN